MPIDFGTRLKELREEAGLSQNALAKKAGISRQAINRIESGESEPSWGTGCKLARALGVSVAAFDTGDDFRPTPAPKAKGKPPKR